MSEGRWLINVVPVSLLKSPVTTTHQHDSNDSVAECPTCKAAAAYDSPPNSPLPLYKTDVEGPSPPQNSQYAEYLAIVIRRVRPRTGQSSNASRFAHIKWGHYGYIAWFVGITGSCIFIFTKQYTLSLIFEAVFFSVMFVCWGMELWVRGWRNAHFGLEFFSDRKNEVTPRPAPTVSSQCPV